MLINKQETDIFHRMAVLWAQREMVQELYKLEQTSYSSFLSTPETTQLVYIGTGEHWIFENELIDRMLLIKEKTIEDMKTVDEFKRILNSCIKEGYIFSQENENYLFSSLTINSNLTPENCSLRFVQVSEDKGMKLLSRWYYYLKYLPEIFPQPTGIIASVLVSVITAILTTILTLWISKNTVSDQRSSPIVIPAEAGIQIPSKNRGLDPRVKPEDDKEK